MDLSTAISTYDCTRATTRVANAEQQRKLILATFPLEDWPTLPLERYALNCEPEAFCRLMEYRTVDLGGIGGGSATKHILYLGNSGEWYIAPALGDEVGPAWSRLRGQFVDAFEAVERGAFDELDELDALRSGQSLVTKSLSVYFPQHFLPIFSGSHLRSFISLLGGTPERYAPAWRANRQLLALVKGDPELSQWAPHEVMQFLYDNFDPREPSRPVWKVAPGENAVHWQDCFANGYICVGWDELGDLSQYASDTELKQELAARWPKAQNASNARNLLAYRDLEPGDRIVANHGMSKVLAIGTVTGGYRFDDSRTESKHVVPVEWDTSFAQHLENPQSWRRTLVRVPDHLFTKLTSKRGNAAQTADHEVPEDISAILAALQRKNQVILSGPPGTGKTRLALSTALAARGRTADVDGPGRTAAINELLDTGRVRMVTFHPSYGYEDFVEGFKPAHHPTAAGLHLELTDGLFHKLCADAAAAENEEFLLIIDEINRGDLPRIFGELVTLLETDKRGVSVDLPISQRRFAVPPNVRIIGTMNTADRSVSHLDAAIRRRFAFVTVGPDPEVLSGTIGPLDLPDFLSALNERIVTHLDADHQIGHAYLLHNGLPVATEEELAAAYYHDVLPLIEDYCVSRAELLHRVLGSLVDANTGQSKRITDNDLPTFLAAEFTSGTLDLDE
ncbi:McrB family protein [Nocardia sp. NPDC059195]|uniref:McrB family protein n=1 Tax=Nocardia sp. NPDC059195 TaxID=3346765 RepID=UPI003699D4DD